MKKGVTLKDIARKLNMSVSTVSKALSGDASISIATRDRVQKLALEWHYIPNEAARHFKQNKTFTLGLILPDLLDQFYVLAINGVEEIAAQNKYNVIVSQTHEDAQKEKDMINIMIRSRVDGVIIAISKRTSDMSSFQELLYTGIPLVFLAREPPDLSYDHVSSDNLDGAIKAMELLFGRGHERIGHLMGPSTMPVSHRRLEGYRHALETRGISFDERLVKEIDFTPDSTATAMRSLMEMENPPTALLMFKSYVSLDAVSFLRKQYPARLPAIDMVGFGNLPMLQYLDHQPLASVEEDSHRMGVEAARLLFSRIDQSVAAEDGPPRHVRVPCTLVAHR